MSGRLEDNAACAYSSNGRHDLAWYGLPRGHVLMCRACGKWRVPTAEEVSRYNEELLKYMAEARKPWIM